MEGGEWPGGHDYGKENESLGEHILEEMESFWLDIDERLTISRMVSDSVIKGMVNAIEQQAAERVARKESEVVELKKMLCNCRLGLGETKTLCSSVPCQEPREDATRHFEEWLSKVLHSEWQEEQEFQSEVERMVIGNCVWSLQQEFEQKLWDLYESESRNCFNQQKEISSLRQELDSIFKTLYVYETGQLIYHGSLENVVEENGKHEYSKMIKLENLDPPSLKHMSKDELVTYYNSEITKMRRNHESQVQEVTEENFRLKRELLNLKERGSSLPLKKDKDFDSLKKKIPDVISKLDKILNVNEKVHPFSENIESLSSLKDKLDFLLSENHHLQDVLTDKKKESKSHSSQLSAALEKLSQQKLYEKILLQKIQDLDNDLGDAHAEASVIQDVYKCLYEDVMREFRCITEELHLRNSIAQEIYEMILKETAHNTQASRGLEIEEADVESTMMQLMQGQLDINHIIFKEALVDANKALKLEAAEKEELNQEMIMLTSIVEEKEKLAQKAEDALIHEKQKMELTSEYLRAQTVQQQKLIAENNKELDVTKGELVVALKKIEQYEEQICKLHQNLEQRNNEIREINEERRLLHAITQKKQDALMLIEAKERETRTQMGLTIDLSHKLLTMVSDLEARVNEDTSRNCLRLENMSSEFCCLNDKAKKLKTKVLVYKQKLETRCSDFEKAETEVDLLGDEVDTLRNLLEKIYIALDHYSPILKHYPGIIEILELVRRELSGESRKLV